VPPSSGRILLGLTIDPEDGCGNLIFSEKSDFYQSIRSNTPEKLAPHFKIDPPFEIINK
jgi:hypothetical protein